MSKCSNFFFLYLFLFSEGHSSHIGDCRLCIAAKVKDVLFVHETKVQSIEMANMFEIFSFTTHQKRKENTSMVLKKLSGGVLTDINETWLRKNRNDRHQLINGAIALNIVSKDDDVTKVPVSVLRKGIGNYLKNTLDDPWKKIDMLQHNGFEIEGIEKEFFDVLRFPCSKLKKNNRKMKESFQHETDMLNEDVLKREEIEHFRSIMKKIDKKESDEIECQICRKIKDQFYTLEMKLLLDEPKRLFNVTKRLSPHQSFASSLIPFSRKEDVILWKKAVNHFVNSLKTQGATSTLVERNKIIRNTSAIANPIFENFNNVLNFLGDRALSFYETQEWKDLMHAQEFFTKEQLATIESGGFRPHEIIMRKNKQRNGEIGQRSGVTSKFIENLIDAESLQDDRCNQVNVDHRKEHQKVIDDLDALSSIMGIDQSQRIFLNGKLNFQQLKKFFVEMEKKLKMNHVLSSAQTSFSHELKNNSELVKKVAEQFNIAPPFSKIGELEFRTVKCLTKEIPGIIGDFVTAIFSV